MLLMPGIHVGVFIYLPDHHLRRKVNQIVDIVGDFIGFQFISPHANCNVCYGAEVREERSFGFLESHLYFASSIHRKAWQLLIALVVESENKIPIDKDPPPSLS